MKNNWNCMLRIERTASRYFEKNKWNSEDIELFTVYYQRDENLSTTLIENINRTIGEYNEKHPVVTQVFEGSYWRDEIGIFAIFSCQNNVSIFPVSMQFHNNIS